MMCRGNKSDAFNEDNHRCTNPRRISTTVDARILFHTSRHSARVYTVRELRTSAKNKVVAQTIVHLLPRLARNEGLCLLHLPNMPVDNTGW